MHGAAAILLMSANNITVQLRSCYHISIHCIHSGEEQPSGLRIVYAAWAIVPNILDFVNGYSLCCRGLRHSYISTSRCACQSHHYWHYPFSEWNGYGCLHTTSFSCIVCVVLGAFIVLVGAPILYTTSGSRETMKPTLNTLEISEKHSKSSPYFSITSFAFWAARIPCSYRCQSFSC